MYKFFRNYLVQIEVRGGGVITVGLPYSIDFDITRNTLSSANVCQVRLRNLAPDTRDLIRWNQSDYGNPRTIRLFAGYGEDITNLGEIFSGTYNAAWSVREGVDFITQIECYDGGFAFANGDTNIQFPAGTPLREQIRAIMAKGLPGVTPGAVGLYPGFSGRRCSYVGNTADILSGLTGNGFFIDRGQAHALATNEFIASQEPIFEINAATGLLNTPTREVTIARFEMIFEPRLNVGYLVRISSATESSFNGVFKITAVKHRGTISPVVCGEVITTGEFIFDKDIIPAVRS